MQPRTLWQPALWQVGGNRSEKPVGPGGFYIPSRSEDACESVSAALCPTPPPPSVTASILGHLAELDLYFLNCPAAKMFVCFVVCFFFQQTAANLLGETRAADTDSSTNRSHVCVPAVPQSLHCSHRARRVPSLPTLPPKPSLTGPPGTMLLQMCAQAPAVHVTHPMAPSRCTPSVTHPRTEICHFTKIRFSHHLLHNFIVLFSAAERAVWVPEHRMGEMRSRALPCTWTHAPMAPLISAPPKLLPGKQLPSLVPGQALLGVCAQCLPALRFPRTLSWDALTPRPPLRHSSWRGPRAQRTHARL